MFDSNDPAREGRAVGPARLFERASLCRQRLGPIANLGHLFFGAAARPASGWRRAGLAAPPLAPWTLRSDRRSRSRRPGARGRGYDMEGGDQVMIGLDSFDEDALSSLLLPPDVDADDGRGSGGGGGNGAPSKAAGRRGGRGRGRGRGGSSAASAAGSTCAGGGGGGVDAWSPSSSSVAKKGYSKDGRDTRASTKARVAKCGIFCGEEKELAPKQKGRISCFTDLATMRRDAKVAGEEAAKFLASCEKNDPAKLKELHTKWSETVGKRESSEVRVGIFDWAQYTVEYSAATGSRSEQESVMKTEKDGRVGDTGDNGPGRH